MRKSSRIEDFGSQMRRKRSRNLQTVCPTITFTESYITTYGLATFQILPTITMTCGTTSYSVSQATVSDAGVPLANRFPQVSIGQAFSYDMTNKLIKITDWSRLSTNSFYNITLTLTAANTQNSQTVTVKDSFILVLGTVDIIYTPMGDRYFGFKETIAIDYTTAFDPMQPETGALSAAWTCPSWFMSCSTLKLKQNKLDPLTLINVHKIVFGMSYLLNVTIQNPNVKYLKSIVDAQRIYVNSPLVTDQPLSCLDFKLVYKNTLMPFNRVQPNEREILFDNNNYTDVIISSQTTNFTSCTSLFGPNLTAIAFVVYDNPDLFDDMRSYYFNTSGITIPKARIQKSFISQVTQKVTAYAYLQDKITLQILGYQYQTLVLQMSDQTLYAKTAQNFVQVDSDKVLYIDGGSSYDLKSNYLANITYTWTLEGSTLKFPNQKILTLAPDQRNQYLINQPGKYYSYLLVVSDSNRTSLPTRVTVQITPELDSANCVTVGLKDIDLEKIIAYTSFPLLLQAKVTKGTCAGMSMGALIWSCNDVNWQFWQTVFNNYTIGIERTDLQKLPKSRDITMTITQYYKRNDIEFISVLNFVLFVERPDLVPVIKYPTVFNPRELTQLTLDANSSYDPQADAAGTTAIPIKCTWECPAAFQEACTSVSTIRTNNGCTMNFISTTILNSTNYNFQLAGNMHLFKLSIAKDSRVTKSYVYVTIIDSSRYPKCAISISKPTQNSINQFINISSSCNSTSSVLPSKFTYLWSLYQWDTQSYVPEILKLTTDVNFLRVPPYILGMYKELLVQLVVTADVIYTTPIGLYYKANDQSYFKSGSISINYNQFTSYLSNFVLTPSGWDSGLSSELLFQYRIKESDSSFRVLMSPVESYSDTQISTILPPFIYEKALYIDVIDTLGNYITLRQPMISVVDQMMTATQFAVRVNAIIQVINTQFNEEDLESKIFSLRQYFYAYANDQINLESMPAAFFRILSENTLQYLYNTFYIDKRLSQVLSIDRRTLINQHLIEIVHAITKKHRATLVTLQFQQGLILINQIVSSGNYTLGNTIPEITSKLFQIAFQTFDSNLNFQIDTSGNVYDQIILKLLTKLQSFLYLGETLSDPLSGGFNFQLVKIGTTSGSLLDISGQFTYDKNEVFRVASTAQAGGIMIVARNDTFTYVQVYDKALNQLSITKLTTPVKVGFKIPDEMLPKYLNGSAQIRCASRDKFADAWTSTRITMNSVNNKTGDVLCSATHFTQYTLFIVDKTGQAVTPVAPLVDPTTLTNKTTNDTVIVGKWNDTLKNTTTVNVTVNNTIRPYLRQPIFEEQPTIMYGLAISTLVVFVLLHFYYKLVYQSEHKEQPQRDVKHFYVYQPHSRCLSLLRLYGLIMLNFNPYLNLWTVYNKFLLRWVRNIMLQVYFMTISIAFAINSALLSLNQSQDVFSTQQTKVALFFIIVVGVILLRPMVIKVMYKVLYEPYGRVEDYPRPEETTAQVVVHQDAKVVDISDLAEHPLDAKEQQENLDSCHDNKGGLNDEKQGLFGENKSGGQEEFLPPYMQSSSMRNNKTFGVRNQQQNFLPSIFDQGPPRAARHTVKQTSFEQQQQKSQQSESRRGSQPQFASKIRGFQEMAQAFDEIIIDDPINGGDAAIVIEDEQQLDRSNGSIEAPQSPQRKVSVKQSLPPVEEGDQEIKFSAGKAKPKGKVKGKKKKTSEKKDQIVIQESNALPPIGRRFNMQSNEVASNMFYEPQFDNNQGDSSMQSHPPHADRSITNLNRQPALQFYGSNQSLQQDSQEEHFDYKFEGGEDEEEFKGPSDGTHDNAKLESVEREESQPSDEKRIKSTTMHHSPTTDFHSGLINYPSSNDGRFIANSNGTSPDQKRKNLSDEVMEATLMNIQIKSGESINPAGKTIYVNKMVGKTFLMIYWVCLLIANLICLIKMRQDDFIDWAIMSVSAFASIILIIDPLLYFILACLMLKQESDETIIEGVRRGSFKGSNVARTNDKEIEYYTDKASESGGSEGKHCARLFVSLFIGKEKMKDLRRRLNPYNPV